jgi:vitamin B12 transporter
MKRVIFSLFAITVLLANSQVCADETQTVVAQDEQQTAVNEWPADTRYDLGNVIVSATKTETYQAEIGSSTTVITSEDIKKKGKREVLSVLRDVPGLAVSQNGTNGGTTSVFLRGAGSGHTLVMIDGVEVNDPIASGRSFDFTNLLTDNIERIEIVRGPQSTLYGSDAMAGVINIITKKGTGKPQVEASFEGGSHNTFMEYVGFSGTANDKFNYSLSATRLDSGGLSKSYKGAEKDPYHNSSFSTKLGYKILDNTELSLSAIYTNARTGLDGGGNTDVENYTAWSKDLSSRFAVDQSLFSVKTSKKTTPRTGIRETIRSLNGRIIFLR